MRRKVTFLAISILLVLTMVLAVGCGSKETAGNDTGQAEDSGKYTLAVVGPMTGDSASQGIQYQRAVQIAVDEINAKGGVGGKKLEFLVGDDQANPNQGLIVAQKFADNKDILAIIGHNNSGVTLACLPTYQKAGLPVVSPTNTAIALTESGYDNFFRVIVRDDVYKQQFSEFAVKELGSKKPAVVWENTDYGKGGRDVIVAALEGMGVEVTGDLSYTPGTDRDFSAQITKLKGEGSDVVLYLGDYTNGALFEKQAKTLGLKATFLGAGDVFHPDFIKIGDKDTEGAYILTAFDANNSDPAIKTFVDNYKSKYDEEPGEWASHAYDTVMVIAKAIENGGTDRAKLIEAIRNIDYQGVSGHIKFDAKGDVSGKKIFPILVKDGKFTSYNATNF
ncbi:MAG: ABC transporter substrate-binding protein [Dehalobacterium sp.]